MATAGALIWVTSCGPARTVDRTPVTLARPDAAAIDGAGLPPPPRTPDGAVGDASADAIAVDTTVGPPDAAPDSAAPPDVIAPPPPPPDAAIVPPQPDAMPDLAPPPQPPFARVAPEVAPPATDLTAEGKLDWIHWGKGMASAVNHKAGDQPLIALTVLAGQMLKHYADRPVTFSWTDGTPTASATGIADGVDVENTSGGGFELRFTGDPAKPRTARVHVGTWGARAKIEVRWAGQPAVLYSDDSLTAGKTGVDRVYALTFQPVAAANQLVVRWTVETLNEQYGNATIQAATLAE